MGARSLTTKKIFRKILELNAGNITFQFPVLESLTSI